MFFTIFLAAVAAPASPPAPPPAPPVIAPSKSAIDPAAVAEAIKMLDDSKFDEEGLRSAELMMDVSLAAMIDQIQKKSGNPVPQDFQKELRTLMHDHLTSTLRARMSHIKQEAAKIYAQEFTAEELRRIRELSNDPVMLKSRERNKVIGPKLMALGVYAMRDTEPELEAKINRLVEDYLAREKKSANHS